jgi:1,4-dihydroxy-2-naphthoate octaprenyltransferase
VSRIVEATRAIDWWDYKLLSIVQVFAATALVLHVPLSPLWFDAALLVAAIAIGAVFASLINDITDLADDARAGKPNQVARMPRGMPTALLLLTVTYLCAWIAFVAYSVPPLRVKARGGWGVVAMASGEAALPGMVAALLCHHAAGRPLNGLWILAVAIWSFGNGARAIVWHQLNDEGADREAQIKTFVQSVGRARATRIVTLGLFPVELAGLAAMLAMIGSIWPVIGLGLYLFVVFLRTRFWRYVAVIVTPQRNHMLILQEYYLGFLPLTILIAAALRHPTDAFALLVLPVLFPFVSLRIFGGTLKLGLWLVAGMRHKIRHRPRPAA